MAKEEKTIWIFKSKKEMIISIILFVVFLIGFIILGTKDYGFSGDKVSKAGSIEEYKMVPKGNVFTSINATEAYSKIRYKNVIILFGSSNNDYVGYYAKYINQIAKKSGITEVYYYNITADRESNNATYEAIVNYLNENLSYIDTNEAEIYAPLLMVKVDGVLTYFNESHAVREGSYTAEEYWNNYRINEAKEELTEIFTAYNEGVN